MKDRRKYFGCLTYSFEIFEYAFEYILTAFGDWSIKCFKSNCFCLSLKLLFLKYQIVCGS